MFKCKECNSKNAVSLKTYKRIWHVCKSCNSGYPEQRSFYPLQFLPFGPLGKQKMDASEMYDYFVDEVHIEYSKKEAADFEKKYVLPGHLEIKGKKVLDVSGGNGVFLSEIVKKGAKGLLTEYNAKAVEFAKSNLGLEAVQYDLNRDKIEDLCKGKFDLIFLRACTMFCDDLPNLLQSLRKLLKRNGKIFVQYAVYPTLGTLLRTQLDEFSYMKLRSPSIIRQNFKDAGFKEEFFEDEIDPSMYAYDHDTCLPMLVLHYYYELLGVLKLRKNRHDILRSRSRNRGNFIFKIS